jgi:hypothetical protein
VAGIARRIAMIEPDVILIDLKNLNRFSVPISSTATSPARSASRTTPASDTALHNFCAG